MAMKMFNYFDLITSNSIYKPKLNFFMSGVHIICQFIILIKLSTHTSSCRVSASIYRTQPDS